MADHEEIRYMTINILQMIRFSHLVRTKHMQAFNRTSTPGPVDCPPMLISAVFSAPWCPSAWDPLPLGDGLRAQ